MTAFNAYLFFDGNCGEAMRFYERALGAKIETLMTDAEVPADSSIPPGKGHRIMHARVSLGGNVLMASDDRPGDYQGMKGFNLSLSYATPAEAHKAFDALAQDGKVKMQMEATFWSPAFGMVEDQFGVPWMVGCEPKT